MIDLTPLEVRKKKGDFRRTMRGYDPSLVDDFLDLVADRLEELVRENMSHVERFARQEQQVVEYREREKALTEALVTAQEMREEIRRQSTREAELAMQSAEQETKQLRASAEHESTKLRSEAQREAAKLRGDAQQEAARVRAETERLREREESAMQRLHSRQRQFLGSYRAFLERELTELDVVTQTLGLAGAAAAAPSPVDSLELTPIGNDTSREPGSGSTAGAANAALDSVFEDRTQDESTPVDDAAFSYDFVQDDSDAGTDDDIFEPEPFEPEPFEPELIAQNDMFTDEDETFTDEDEADDDVPGADERTGPRLTLMPEDPDMLGDDAAGRPGGRSAAGRSAAASGAARDGSDASGGDDSREPPLTRRINLVDTTIGHDDPWGIDSDDTGDGDDDGEDDDEETSLLLRNAAAAGYRLPDEDELLLDETVDDSATTSEENDEDDDERSWLPTLLDDPK